MKSSVGFLAATALTVVLAACGGGGGGGGGTGSTGGTTATGGTSSTGTSDNGSSSSSGGSTTSPGSASSSGGNSGGNNSSSGASSASACVSGGGDNGGASSGSSPGAVPKATAPCTYTVSGTVSGLQPGLSVSLQSVSGAAAESLKVAASGNFALAKVFGYGETFVVTVAAQPNGQICTVANGRSFGVTMDVGNVSVICSTVRYKVSGTVSGLAAGKQLTLLNNGGDPVLVGADGAFEFGTPVAGNSNYAVTVGTAPAGQTCTVDNASGAGVAAEVRNISVNCSSNTYTIAGTVAGLGSGKQVILLNNEGDPVIVKADGGFVFATPVASNSNYAVTIGTQPNGQTCTVAGGSGSGVVSNVGGIAVVCSTNTYTVAGTASGLASGSQITLMNNAGNPTVVGSNGGFAFSTPVAANGVYGVTVATQPKGQTCTVANGSGSGIGANVTGVAVSCVTAPTTNTWTWAAGSSTMNPKGVYGTLGVPCPASSCFPGGRNSAVSWVDGSGNFWLFGGWGLDRDNGKTWLNDLWRYNPSANTWTWVAGSPVANQRGAYGALGVACAATSCYPGARDAGLAWTDASGNLWLFGGAGNDAFGIGGPLNDLWRYNPSANTWTWVAGSNTIGRAGAYGTRGTACSSSACYPGARHSSVSWTDRTGNFWLFGGVGLDGFGNQDELNDLWKYSAATNTWTWVAGADKVNQPGAYPALGATCAASTCAPGARNVAMAWADKSGDLWLFAGYGADRYGTMSWLNDLWRYSPSNNTWTWVSGSSIAGQHGIYGTFGVPCAAQTCYPGARDVSLTWTDPAGNLWLFGGVGFPRIGVEGALNDLWRYSPTANTWTWVAGSEAAYQAGAYGAPGTACSATACYPGARNGGVSWSDAAGGLWLFGGYGFDGAGNRDQLNDLWKYTP